jgi:hypothetical protein
MFKKIQLLLASLALLVARNAEAFEIFGNQQRFSGSPQTFRSLVLIIVDLVNIAIPILVSLAVIGFIWGITQYGFNQDSEETKKTARKMMVWGIIIIFVMVSIYGILNILTNTFFR